MRNSQFAFYRNLDHELYGVLLQIQSVLTTAVFVPEKNKTQCLGEG